MELWALQGIADGTVSLAELEGQHPILGRNLKDFVTTVNRCCRDAYQRFSTCLDEVLTLPIQATKAEKATVLQKLMQTAPHAHSLVLEPDEPIESGTSGSPVVTDDGFLLGVVSWTGVGHGGLGSIPRPPLDGAGVGGADYGRCGGLYDLSETRAAF